MIKLNSKTNKNTVSKFINIEINSINALLGTQKMFSKQILTFLKSFLGNVDIDAVFSDEINEFIADSSSNLSKINANIQIYTKLLDSLENILDNCSDIEFLDTVNAIYKYNKDYENSLTTVLKNNSEIERFIHYIPTLDISEYIAIDNLDKVCYPDCNQNIQKVEKTPEKKQKNSKAVSLVENTLTISETNGTVTLPYTKSELKTILKENPNKYTSLSDIILNKYTIPLSVYKFSAIARFREAYKLVINKEHGSKKDALNLAFELFSNYSLHPAIITACKNLNELDIYLSCLEFNELEDFHFFKIVYEALPVICKKNANEVIA